jgi:hypothetical protein
MRRSKEIWFLLQFTSDKGEELGCSKKQARHKSSNYVYDLWGLDL